MPRWEAGERAQVGCFMPASQSERLDMEHKSSAAARACVYRELILHGVSISDISTIPAEVMDALAVKYESSNVNLIISDDGALDARLVKIIRAAIRRGDVPDFRADGSR